MTTMPRALRLGFGILAALALAAGPAPALACSGPVATYGDAIARAHLIVVGEVSARRFDGAAYDLTIEKVYRGTATSPFSIGATSDPGIPPMCAISFDVGQRVVLALQDARDIDPFSSAGWIIKGDGSLLVEGSISGSPTTAAELFADLDRLPNTAVPTDDASSRPLATLLGVAMVALAALLLLARGRRPRNLDLSRPPIDGYWPEGED